MPRHMTLFLGIVSLAGARGLAVAPSPELAPARTQQAMRVDVSKLGPQVGQQVPDFRLNDQSGKTWTLQSIMGPKGAMLVFFRSADW